MNDVLQLIATAAQQLAQASQLLQQAHTAVQAYGQQSMQQPSQQQQGLPQQQAFGNAGGMQGAVQGFAGQQVPAQNVAQQGFAGQQGAGQQIGGAFGQQPVQQQAQPVTPDMIQQLITPLVQNERIKAALTQQMNEMGIQELGAAQPHQLAELHQRFTNVKQQAEAAGLLGGQQAAPSLI